MLSIKNLERITDTNTAHIIRELMAGSVDPRTVSARCDSWVLSCYSIPSRDEQIMTACDELLGTCGVEGFCSEDGTRGVSYCNTGDPYALTLRLKNGRFTIGEQPHKL